MLKIDLFNEFFMNDEIPVVEIFVNQCLKKLGIPANKLNETFKSLKNDGPEFILNEICECSLGKVGYRTWKEPSLKAKVSDKKVFEMIKSFVECKEKYFTKK